MQEVAQAAPTSPSDHIARCFPFHLVALGIVLYATGPVLARSADASGVVLSFWRLWFGVAAFAIALVVHRVSGREFGSRRGARLAVFAGVVFAINQVCFFTAVKRTSVAACRCSGPCRRSSSRWSLFRCSVSAPALPSGGGRC